MITGHTRRPEPTFNGFKQTRLQSAVEAVVNTLIGLGIAVVANLVAFALTGIEATLWQAFNVAGILTIVSVLRQYVLRRIFNSELWKRVDWKRPWKLKPVVVDVNWSDTGTFMALNQGAIDEETERMMAKEMSDRLSQRISDAMLGRPTTRRPK